MLTKHHIVLLFSQSGSQQGTPSKITSSRKKATPNKRRRCYMCPRIRDRKSQVACESCGYNICKEHRDPSNMMLVMCLNCAGLPGWSFAGDGFDLPTMIPLQGLSPAPTPKKSKKETPKKKEKTGPDSRLGDVPILSPGNLSLMISKVVSLQPVAASQSKKELQPPQTSQMVTESESTDVALQPQEVKTPQSVSKIESQPSQMVIECESTDEAQKSQEAETSQSVSNIESQLLQMAPESESTDVAQLPEVASDVEMLPPERAPPHEAEQKDEMQQAEFAPGEEAQSLESDELKTSPVKSPEIADETSKEMEDKSPVETQVSESEEFEEIQFTPGTELEPS